MTDEQMKETCGDKYVEKTGDQYGIDPTNQNIDA